MADLHRRDFVAMVGAAIAAPKTGLAQQPGNIRRVGVLMPLQEDEPVAQSDVAALRQGLRELGWIEGRNLTLDFRWPGGDVELARSFAREIVSLKPDVILARSTPIALALKAETKTIPIVFVSIAEPTFSGLVTNLAHPTENITGFTNFEASIGGKLLELLKQVSPNLRRAGFIFNPDTAPFAQSYLASTESAAGALGLRITAIPVQSPAEIEAGLSGLAREPSSGLIVIPDSYVQQEQQRDLIGGLVERNRIPAIFANRTWIASGGLIVYAVDTSDLMRRSATYVDRLLKGTKPADLPVQQPSKYELVINLKTARAIGLDVPPMLVALADGVIE
jgi:putative ABC transport system substrate-binding protein